MIMIGRELDAAEIVTVTLDPYQINPAGLTPLQVALKNRDQHGKRRWDDVFAIMAMLDIDHQKARSSYALLIAAKDNDAEVMSKLLTIIKSDGLFRTASNDYAAIDWAVTHDNVGMVDALLESNNDVVNHANVHGITPMQIALSAKSINKAMLRCLLKHGAKFTEELVGFAKNGAWDKIELIMELDADSHEEPHTRLLYIAIDHSLPARVTQLLQYGANFTALPGEPNPAKYAALKDSACVHAMLDFENRDLIWPHLNIILVIAAYKQDWDVVRKVLLLKPSSSGEGDEMLYEKYCALQWLIKHNQMELLEAALAAGCNPNIDGHQGSVLDTALEAQNVPAIRLLVKYKVNLGLTLTRVMHAGTWQQIILLLDHDNRDHSAIINPLLFEVARRNFVELLEYLLERSGVSIHTAVKHIAYSNAPDMSTLAVLLNAAPHYKDPILFADQKNGMSLLEYAELVMNQPAIDVLVKRGANHHPAIMRSARRGQYSETLTLLEKHYKLKPNSNETETDRQFIVGRVLHVMAREAHHQERSGLGYGEASSTFQSLLEKGALLATQPNEINLLARLAINARWHLFERVLDQHIKSPVFTQGEMGEALICCLKFGASENMITSFVKLINDIRAFVDPETGNNLLHWSVLSQRPKLVALFLRMDVDKSAKNKAGKIPLTLLFELAVDNRQNAIVLGEISMQLVGNQDWIDYLMLETDESVTSFAVTSSCERALTRLRQRYPVVHASQCEKEYDNFLKSLPPSLYNSKHLFADRRIQAVFPLLWMAASDDKAFPASVRHQVQTAKEKHDYIMLRRLAIVENFRQSAELRTCGEGTRTRIIGALTDAHPDVFLIYDNHHVKIELQAIIANMVAEHAPRIIGGLSAEQQRSVARYFKQQDPKCLPAYLVPLSELIQKTLKLHHGGSSVKVYECLHLADPTALAKLEFDLPETFIKLAAVVSQIENFVTETRKVFVHSNVDLDHLANLAAGAYDDRPRSLADECALLEKALSDCVDQRCGINLQGFSIFAKAEKQPDATSLVSRVKSFFG
jgi:ankyrin repeat protein